MSKRVQAIVLLLLMASAPSSLSAQQAAPAAKPVATSAQIPMNVLFVLSKYQGDKKISSLPYTVALNSSDPPTEIRMGAQVPTPTTVVKDGNSTPTYTYNQIGVTIRCSVKSMDNGMFSVNVNVSDSSIFVNPALGGPPTSSFTPLVSGVPVFKNFSINSILLLKDGQTTQLAASADPTTGDIMKVDVTLTVVK